MSENLEQFPGITLGGIPPRVTQDADVVAVAAGRVDTSHECLAGRTRQKFPEDFVTLRRLRMVPIMVQKISSLKTPLKAPLTKGVFREVF